MTLQQFRRFQAYIQKETFHSRETSPLLFGIQRAEFEKGKLRRLIAAAEGIESKSIQTKVEQCKRKLQRLDATQKRLSQMHQELFGCHQALHDPGIKTRSIR